MPDASFDLTGRRAVVTGASAGIGAAIAARLAGAGAEVVAVSRSGGVPKVEGSVCPLVADLSGADAVDGVIGAAVAELGGLDILVNNAGRGDWLPLGELDRQYFDGLVGLNLWAPLRLCQLAHPYLAAADDAAVVMIGSVDAVRPSAGGAVYGATKAGLAAVTVALAKDLATIDLLCEGRLVVQPTVSWQRAEYEAHGVAFSERGLILDEHLEAMSRLWAGSPSSFSGRYFSFEDAYCEPNAWRSAGPRMWFGGEWMHPALIRRMARYGSGFHPFGAPTADDLAQLAEGLAAAGRDISEIELIGGTRANFASPDAVVDVDDAMAAIDEQVAAGYTLFCMNPSQYTDDIREVAGICRRMVDYCGRCGA